MKAATEKVSPLLVAAGVLIISLPFVRLVEAGLRMIFMKDHYGSFWEGLTRDVWFSDGWLAYVGTPLGLTMTLLPAAMAITAVGCIVVALK